MTGEIEEPFEGVDAKIAGDKRAKGLSKSDWLILGAVTVLCIGLMALFFRSAGAATESVKMGVHGWIALGVGVTLSMAVGIGLMALVFFSARHGFDDRVQVLDEDE